MIYLKLFIEFFIIGAFTFGGGYAMLPLIQQVVLDNQWLTEQQLVDFIAVSESTPGPLAVNMSTYIGVRTADLGGAFVSTLGIVLPSFLIIIMISQCYEKYQSSRVVKSAMEGLQPAVVALITAALLSIGGNVLNVAKLLTVENLVSVVIILIAGFLCYKKKHPIIVIGVSALIGVLSGYM